MLFSLRMYLNKAVSKNKRDNRSERALSLKDKDDIAKQIGVGAVVFNTLLNGRIKDIQFSLG